MTPPTLAEIAGELRTLAELMRNTSDRMRYVAGLNKVWNQHAGELAGAANIAEDWAAEIEKELAE